MKKRFKNEQRSRDAAAKKRVNTSRVVKVIIMRISIYLLTTTPPNHIYTF